MWKVFVLQTTGEHTLTEQAVRPSLKEMQKAVGGLIEPVDNVLRRDGIFSNKMLKGDFQEACYVNEEGLMCDMDRNHFAEYFTQYPFLVGPMVAYWKSDNKPAQRLVNNIIVSIANYGADACLALNGRGI